MGGITCMENRIRTTKAQRELWWRKELINPNDADRESFPELMNISSAFFFQFQAIPNQIKKPEYVSVPEASYGTEPFTEATVFVAQWNSCWESAQARFDLFLDKIPTEFKWLEKAYGRNLMLIPRPKGVEYYSYCPIYHLLPTRILQHYGLPLRRKGLWPHGMRDFGVEEFMPCDLRDRLSRAFSYYIWPLLNRRSRSQAFSKNDPIKVISHSLDFWLPYLDMAIQERLYQFGRCDFESSQQQSLIEEYDADSPRVTIARPLHGGPIWSGEAEAWEIASRMVDISDQHDKLRAIIDAIQSQRVEDDFSDRWSYEREDFERRLYRKRSKTRVKFVELRDTIPTYGPESQVVESLFWQDFIATLDTKNREIVVMLRSGITSISDIAHELGYANHSAVSKRLKRIRQLAERYLEN